MRRHAHLIGVLARYLAQPVLPATAAIGVDAPSLAVLLQRGDVLLTQGVSRMAKLVTRATGSPWSHVSMYVGALDNGTDPRCVVEADIAAGVRAVPLSEFRGLRVRVLRPVSLQESDRSRLVEWVVSRIGDEYDVAQAWALAQRWLRVPSLRRQSPPAPRERARRYICSTLLAHAFGCVGCSIVPVHAASEPDLRWVTPRDFERAPIFEVVRCDPQSQPAC